MYKVPVDLWDCVQGNNQSHISTLDEKVFCWDPEISAIHHKPLPEFPYDRVNSNFVLFDEQNSKIGHNLELDENGLQKFVVTTRPNPFFKPGFVNLDEAERLTDFVYVGKAQFNDFMKFGQYALQRYPRIAEELVCANVRHEDVVKPGIIKGKFLDKEYEGRVDLVRFQSIVCKRFYTLIKQFAIQRAAVSLDKGGLTAEQIREILCLIEPLKID